MSKTTVLIVEDEAIVAADLAGRLQRLGYEVAGVAAKGEEAVELACRFRPCLVLMDIRLEGPMDGIEAAEAIRREHDAPVIYLTAHSDAATLARAKLTGPFGYILKPFEERDLATQIELALYKHQADRELREQREWLRVTLTSIGDAVLATDGAGRITFLNPVAESITGWKAADAAGRPVRDVFRIVNESDGQTLEDPVARVLAEGRTVALENHTALVAKDGRIVPIDDSAAPILDAAGKVIGAVLVFHDVTERRRAEERARRTLEELARSNRDLEQFAYAVSHDLKEPLRMVTGFSGLLKDRYYGKLDEKADQYISFAAEAAERMNGLIDDLLAYARAGRDPTDEQTDVSSAVDRAVGSLRASIEECSARVTVEPMPTVRGNPVELTQLFQNLLGNALKFRAGNVPEIHVGVRREEEQWVFEVRDNGIGIDPKFSERVFTIFQRLHTRDEYPGTGIGLAICKRIVERHGGSIWFESEPGKGSSFFFTLPA